jgi:hypothetical protein
MESQGLPHAAARRESPDRQFASLRKSNEYHAHVAHILRDKRALRARIERVMQTQRQHRFRQDG